MATGVEGDPRIVTLTLNPTVDIACAAPAVVPTHKIRTSNERLDPGGGGINVARVLHSLGTDALALVMTGGVTGRVVEELLDENGVRWRALPVHGRTRICLNVHDMQSKLEYRFVAEGPEVSEAEWRGALDALRVVKAGWVVASGSLPRGVPTSFYADAATIAAGRGQRFVLDTSGAALRASLGQGIEVLKLSLGEFEFLIGETVRELEQQKRAAAALQQRRAARMIAVSLGSGGALLAGPKGVAHCPAPPVEERSSVGAGDSFVAGLVSGLAQGMAEENALALAVAAGSAAVGAYGTALVNREDVERLFRGLCSGKGRA